MQDCDWKSREVVPDTAEMLLKAHIKLKHIPVFYTPPARATLPQDIEGVERHLASQMDVQKQAQLRNMAALPEISQKATEDSPAHHPVAKVATHTARYMINCKHSDNRACQACIEAEYSKGGKFAQDFDDYLKQQTQQRKAREDTTLLSPYTTSILPLAKQELEVEHETVDKQLVEPVHQQEGDCHNE